MFGKILIYGAAAGVIVGGLVCGVIIAMHGHTPHYGMVIGYASMLIGLSAVFLGVKRYRDVDLGGVIRFWPALGMGLAMSVIAGIIYSLAWEATQSLMHLDFATGYAKIMIAQQKAAGVHGKQLADFIAQMEQFKAQYANPLYRLPMTFIEIFPVGVLVSLVSAGLLRNSRFLPAR
jgi:Protein of unknown function (DUF4199)